MSGHPADRSADAGVTARSDRIVTRTSIPPDDGCCALDDGHDGPCAGICSHCQGSGRCPACAGTGGYDDVQRCTECDAGCCPYCDEGLVSDEY